MYFHNTVQAIYGNLHRLFQGWVLKIWLESTNPNKVMNDEKTPIDIFPATDDCNVNTSQMDRYRGS